MPEEAPAIQVVADAPKAMKLPLWRRIPVEVWSMGIAAMLVIGIGLGVLLSFDDEKDEEWSCYEGSYVVVNGKRITDVKKIMPIILETLAEAEAMEKDLEARLAENDRIEKYVAEKEAMLENY